MKNSRGCFCYSRRLVAILIGCGALSIFAADHSIQAGDRVPDFSLPAVRGGSFQLRPAAGQPTLLAFLQTVPDTADTPSRSEVALLQSMNHQYRARGLRVVIIDATALAAGHRPDHDSLINASYDWNLEVPLLEDDGGRVARSMGVTHTPTTILVSADGRAAQVWERSFLPGEIALAIETTLGSGPLIPGSKPSPTK